MYSYDDPVGFISAFYGCLIAGVVPVPIDPPVKKEVCIFLIHFCQCSSVGSCIFCLIAENNPNSLKAHSYNGNFHLS